MAIRINKVLKECNVGLQTVVDFLFRKGYIIDANINTKISDEQYELICKEFSKDAIMKNRAAVKLNSRSILYDFIEDNKPIDTEEKIDKLFELCYKIHRNITNEVLKDIIDNTTINLHVYVLNKKSIFDEDLKKYKKKMAKNKRGKGRKHSFSPYNKDGIVYKWVHIISTRM